jgi:glycosyltransferase involved in cell wall biosynthesis
LKIIVLASTYPRYYGDGSGRFVQSIAEEVQKLGHEVHVVAPYHPLVEYYESSVQIHHFRYIWRDDWYIMGYAKAMQSDRKLKPGAIFLAPLYFFAMYREIKQLLNQKSFDVIHVHWVIPNGPVALLLAKHFRLPIVVTLHGSDIFFSLKNSCIGWFARQVFRYASVVTACSPDLRAGAIKLGSPASRVQLLPWGADPDVFSPNRNIAKIREKHGLSTDIPILLSLGRLVRKKGLKYLIQAMPMILSAQPKTVLLIAGNGPEKNSLQNLTHKLGVQESIQFIGEIEWQDVPDYLALTDVFAVPSIHDEHGNLDGLPTTILEAMASGCPIVATDVAGIPLVIQHEYNGLLVPEAQPEALANAIIMLLNNPDLALRYGLISRNRVIGELNWQQIAKHFEKFYQTSISQVER